MENPRPLKQFLKNITSLIPSLKDISQQKVSIYHKKMIIVKTGENSEQNLKISECLEADGNRMKGSSSLRAKLLVHQNILTNE